MGRRRRTDAIDLACQHWARQRRVIVGIAPPTFNHEYVGPLTCTLEKVKRFRDGAGSTVTTRLAQHFPEVYSGDAQIVNRAYHAMRPDLRAVMDLHYVAHGPVSLKVDALALSPRVYFNRLSQVRSFVEGFLASHV